MSRPSLSLTTMFYDSMFAATARLAPIRDGALRGMHLTPGNTKILVINVFRIFPSLNYGPT